MPSPILARADALMQRRRQHNTEGDELPVLIDAIDEDDIPLLLDVEVTAPATEPGWTEDLPAHQAELPPAVEPAPPALPEELLRELSRRVEMRLSAELPRIIEATLQEFLAEQASLPDTESGA